ncbi:MAG TPA: adenylate/guanylate cyclase domain-containing protein, partial [Actinomycetota bacterium]|nr:adenylate/guanylate cyclase domain-containing protein [Actinomycetota bacterium]
MADLPTGTVTFFFSDIEGSTRLLGALGDAYFPLLEEHQRILREALSDGVEVSTEGDSFFVVFPSAVAAVRAAVAAQRAIAAHEWGDRPVRVRMGMHTGEGRLGADNYVGIDLHRAARVMSTGHGGQIVVSEATRSLVATALDGVQFRDLGEHRLKDIPEPERIYQVVAEGLEEEFPPLKTMDRPRGNLPAQLTSFVGREREVAEVKDLLGGTRLLTLTGPGGTGKTRLSLKIAGDLSDSYEDGAFFVALAPIADPALVVTTIARTLELREDPDRPIMQVLIEHLRDREVLIVLDNFEHVTAAAPSVAELLAATNNLRVLVSSREALQVQGETEYAVPPLQPPDPDRLPPFEQLSQYDAVRLFVDRAMQVRPGFAVSATNAHAIAEITYRLDGLPLAIELAAARVKLLTPDAILARLGDRLELLSGGGRDLPARQQTLRGAIAWSYDLLDEGERRFFRCLAVFRGGFTLESAEAVTGDPDTFEGIASLVNKSLVRQTETEEGEPRFFLLETIRQYAEEKLSEVEGEHREVRDRHARFFLDMVERARHELTGADQARWLDSLAQEHDNFRAALDWSTVGGELSTGLHIAGGLWRFWQMRGHLHEASERLPRLVDDPRAAEDDDAYADALEAAGGVFYWMGKWDEAERYYKACLEIRRRQGEAGATGWALYNLSFMYAITPPPTRDLARSRELLEEALKAFESVNDTNGRGRVLWGLSNLHQVQNEWELTMERAAEARDVLHELGDRFGEGWAVNSLAVASTALGRLEDGRRYMRQGLEL